MKSIKERMEAFMREMAAERESSDHVIVIAYADKTGDCSMMAAGNKAGAIHVMTLLAADIAAAHAREADKELH